MGLAAALMPAVAIAAYGQALPPLETFTVRTFDVADGLPMSEIRGVVQASDQHLLVASAAGLLEYDGVRFQRIPTPGLASVAWIHQDRRGRTWILSDENQLGVLADDSLTIVTVPGYPSKPTPGGTFSNIRSLSETSDGRIWLGGRRGLVRLEGDPPFRGRLYTHEDGLPSDSAIGVFDLPGNARVVVTGTGVADITQDDAGSILTFRPWDTPCHIRADVLRTREGLRLSCGALSILEFQLVEHAQGRSAAALHATFTDDDAWPDSLGRPYYGASFLHHRGRLAALGVRMRGAPAYGTRYDARDGSRWFTVYSDRDEDHLFRITDHDTAELELRRHLEFRRILAIEEDHEGSLWLGTDRGLVQLTPKRVLAMDGRQGLADGATTALLEARDGALWVGTWGGGLHRFANGRLEHRYGIRDGLPSERIRSVHEGRDGTLWVGTYRGSAAIRAGRVIVRAYSPDEVHSIQEGADGRLWMASLRGVAVGPLRAHQDARADTILRGPQWMLHRARDGVVWMGGEQGIFRAADGRPTPLRWHGEAPPFVVSVHEDSAGTLWFGTASEGVVVVRGERIAHLTGRDGLGMDAVWQVLEDDRGGMWLSGPGGVARVPAAEMRRVVSARLGGDTTARLSTPVLLTEADGLPSREGNRSSPGALRLRDGRLAFNSLRGLTVVDPRVEIPPPRTVLQAITGDGREATPVDRGYRVEPGTRQVVVQLTALSFRAPDERRTRYRLDESAEWLDAGGSGAVTLTRLAPGQHTLQARSAVGSSDWGAVAAWRISVPPLWWQTWWFRVLFVAGLASLAVAAYRYRVQRLLDVERLRLRIAADLHDDLGANLSSIALLSQMLQGRTRLEAREQRQLARLEAAALETIAGLRDVIWLVDPRHDTLGAVIQRIRTIAGHLPASVNCEVVTRQAPAGLRLDMAMIRDVLLVTKEALNNVARHAQATRVRVEIGLDGRRLTLQVEDDGRGFDSRNASGGNGLANMTRRAATHGGEFAVRSAPGAGTCLRFVIPIT